MASLSTSRDGSHRVLFKAADGSRQTIYCGKIAKKKAQDILRHVEELEAARLDGGRPSEATSRWLAEISDELRGKLVKHGIAKPKASPEKPRGTTLSELIDLYRDRPKWRNKAPATIRNYEQHFRHMTALIGGDTEVMEVSEAEAEDFHGLLMEEKPDGGGLERSTANRVCDTASMLFRFARKSRLIHANPFEEVERGSIATKRRAFVDAATATLVIDAMKDTQWRLLVALSRWAGLRIPSEPRLLRWGDIDWERNRFTVHSPKTRHHGAGHEKRVIPIFPELRPYLDQQFEEAEEGEELVLPFMKPLDDVAFGCQLRRTIAKLGLEVWPRVFHSMRSTRQTELQETFPAHVVCSWLGNSEVIARKHYLQTTDEHFDRATRNPTQHTPAGLGLDGNREVDTPAKPRETQPRPAESFRSSTPSIPAISTSVP